MAPLGLVDPKSYFPDAYQDCPMEQYARDLVHFLRPLAWLYDSHVVDFFTGRRGRCGEGSRTNGCDTWQGCPWLSSCSCRGAALMGHVRRR